MLEKKRI